MNHIISPELFSTILNGETGLSKAARAIIEAVANGYFNRPVTSTVHNRIITALKKVIKETLEDAAARGYSVSVKIACIKAMREMARGKETDDKEVVAHLTAIGYMGDCADPITHIPYLGLAQAKRFVENAAKELNYAF